MPARAAVHTPQPRFPQAEALAIAGGRILAVGSGGDVRNLIGPHTRVLEVPGGMILPGFQDVHIHAPQAALARSLCWLHDAGSAAEYLEVTRRYAAGHPEAAWIVGEGWAMDAFIGLVFGHHGVGGIAGQLGVLSLYGVALLTLATFRLRRSVLQ